MNIKDIGSLTITLDKKDELIIDGIVRVSMAENKNAKHSSTRVTLKVVAPKELKIERAINAKSGSAGKRGQTDQRDAD